MGERRSERSANCFDGVGDKQMDDDEEYEIYEESPELCPCCHGSGVVHPLTSPSWFLCLGTSECPVCDGRGYTGP